MATVVALLLSTALFPPSAQAGRPARLTATPIAAGAYHNWAVASDGKLWFWGLTTEGQGGSVIAQPARMGDVGGVVAVAGGDVLNLALKSDGTVWYISYPGIQQVAGLSDVVAVDAGKGYGLALKADGTVWQLDGELKPAQVTGLTGIVAVAMGAYYSTMFIFSKQLNFMVFF